MWKVWDDARKRGQSGDFVNLAAENLDDAIWADSWKLVPAEMQDYIKRKFGKDSFMVRRDMQENALARREASVADFWTGQSRMSPKVPAEFQKTATLLLGRDAFKYLVTAEKAWQAGTSVAKNTIVIRSVIVPASNLASNFFQLMTVGVSLRDIAQGERSNTARSTDPRSESLSPGPPPGRSLCNQPAAVVAWLTP